MESTANISLNFSPGSYTNPLPVRFGANMKLIMCWFSKQVFFFILSFFIFCFFKLFLLSHLLHKDVEVNPNPNEVSDYRYFQKEELKEFIETAEEKVFDFSLSPKFSSLKKTYHLFFFQGTQINALVSINY